MPMAHCRLYLLDRSNQVFAGFDMEADTDSAAMITAKYHAGKFSAAAGWEVWRSLKKLHTGRWACLPTI